MDKILSTRRFDGTIWIGNFIFFICLGHNFSLSCCLWNNWNHLIFYQPAAWIFSIRADVKTLSSALSRNFKNSNGLIRRIAIFEFVFRVKNFFARWKTIGQAVLSFHLGVNEKALVETQGSSNEWISWAPGFRVVFGHDCNGFSCLWRRGWHKLEICLGVHTVTTKAKRTEK
jgi:hypothetical protein